MRDWAENCIIKAVDVESEGDLFRGRCENLDEEYQYRFRVIAVNKAGRSEASHASRPKVAKETDLMPFVDARNMTDVTAEAKERVKLDVGIHGEPAPEITWYKGEGEDKVPVESLNDKSIQMMQTDTHAKLIFNNITAAQAGTYTIVARNKSGEDSASGRIKVLDRYCQKFISNHWLKPKTLVQAGST